MTHTPGPWVWHDRSSEDWFSCNDEGLIKSGDAEVCNFGNNETYYNTAGTRPKEADIALICAAPDLLDALENLVIAIGMGWDLEGVIGVSKSAIAKATINQ